MGKAARGLLAELLVFPKLKADRAPSLIFLSALCLYLSKQKQGEARRPLSLGWH